jgi:maltose alpha-D-glucosyltransferase/alpha-amylase
MQWNSDRNAGFSRAVPAKLYFPVIMDPIWGYQAINVEAQESDPSSLLHWTRNMIALRKLFQVFGRGTLEFLHPENRKALAYIRDYTHPDGHTETVLCVANLSRFAQPVQLDLSKYAGRHPVEMLGYVPFPAIDSTPYAITLAPYSFFWLELQPANAPPVQPVTAITGELVEDTPPLPPAAEPAAPSPTIAAVLDNERATIEAALPAYIAKQRWFGGKSRTITSTKIQSTIPITDAAIIALIEVAYDSSEPDLYQLPLSLATQDQTTAVQASSPNAIITCLGDATLFDASADAAFQQALLALIIAGESTTALIAAHSSALDPARLADVPSRLSSAEQSNTSILYDSQAILKLFRNVRTSAENPDVEIARFLTEVAHFNNIPAYFGDLHRASDSTTLAFLQAFAPNDGDGWAWTLTQLDDFYKSVAGTLAPPSDLANHATTYLEAATLIGRRTAELHLALATPTDDPAFAAEPYTADNLTSDRTRIQTQLNTTLNALQNTLPTLPADVQLPARQLLDLRHNLEARIDNLTGDPTLFGQRIRIHGDYHLGQLLRTKSDFLIVDFEGEPARSLAERRQKQSPLRDVAGMLRSFSYAAQSALNTAGQLDPTARPSLEPWATAWEQAASAAFLTAYRDTIAANPDLTPAPGQFDALLLMLLLEKALYELLYELNNRPTWLPIPLTGLLTIAQAKS